MTAKEYLSQIKELDMRIGHKLEEKQRILCDAERITPAGASGGGSGGASDRIGNTVAKLMDLEAEIDKDVDRLADLRHRIIAEIHALHDVRYEKILFKRYVEYKSLEQISVEIGYTYTWTKHMHGYALLAFGKKTTPKST